MADVILWSVPTDANPADVRLRDPGSFSSGVTAAIAWTEADDAYAIAGSLTVTTAIAWIEANDTYALAGTLTVNVALAWTESDDSWAITGDIASASVDAAIAWTEENDAWAVSGSVATPYVPAVGGGGGGWLGATRAEEKRLIEQIEAVLRETLAPKKSAPILRTLAGVNAVAEVRVEVERMAEAAVADAQLQEVLADVQARIAIFVARQKRQRDDEELMMVL